MSPRILVIAVARIAILAGAAWVVWALVRAGLPLQWPAIVLGGGMALAMALTFLIDPLFRRAAPDLEARVHAVLGYSVPRTVQITVRVAYLVAGLAALIWGLTTL